MHFLEFDFKNPDYTSIIKWRLDRLKKIRKNPSILKSLKVFYRENPAQFITDWGCTFDPRNPEKGLPAILPFILMPKQEEWIRDFLTYWKNQENWITEKTREVGLSWLMIATAATVCLFNSGIVAGFGSRKQELISMKGSPKALFTKAIFFTELLPKEFTGEWSERTHAKENLIQFNNGSYFEGESGYNIGRGARSSFYFVDEAAFIDHYEKVDAALSQTTPCRIEISTPNGMNNVFAQRRHSGKIPVFTFHWRDDLRKSEEWYQKQKDILIDPVIIAQELDIDYNASTQGILIPSAWVQASIDAHKKLNIDITGIKLIGFDIADEGKDLNAVCVRHGILIKHVESWSGKGNDVFGSVAKTFTIADLNECEKVIYDSSPIGAGVRGDARIINEKRSKKIAFDPFIGSSSVISPRSQMVNGINNEDFFANLKAQSWWNLRLKFLKTYRAVTEKSDFNPDDLISISSEIKEINQLTVELSQPTFSTNSSGKVLIDKSPEGSKSPNLADSLMMCFVPKTGIWGMIR